PTGVAHDASKLAATKSLSAVPVNTVWPASDWWKRYGDPQLDALMDEALRTSPTLEIAAARTRQALAAAQVTDAGRFPRVDASASLTHERFSERGLVPPPYAGSWQTDAERAAEVDAEAAKLALATSIAEAYAEMQHAFAKRDVANKTLADREAILKL